MGHGSSAWHHSNANASSHDLTKVFENARTTYFHMEGVLGAPHRGPQETKYTLNMAHTEQSGRQFRKHIIQNTDEAWDTEWKRPR